MMQSVATYLTWIELALVVIVALLAVVWAIRLSKPRRVKPPSQHVVGVFPFLMVWAVLYITGLALNVIWAIVALVVGIGLGYLVARGSRPVRYKDHWVVKPSPVPPWSSAVAWVLVAIAVAFLGPSAVSVSLLLVILAAAMALSGTILDALRSRGGAPAPSGAGSLDTGGAPTPQ